MSTYKCRSGDSSHAHDDTGMLDVFIRIEQSRSANAYILALNVTYHLINRIRLDKLDVVVQEKDVFTSRKLHAEIVDGRIVKRSLPLYHANARFREFHI